MFDLLIELVNWFNILFCLYLFIVFFFVLKRDICKRGVYISFLFILMNSYSFIYRDFKILIFFLLYNEIILEYFKGFNCWN